MKIIDGEIYNYVRTDKMGSECEFAICCVEIWKKMTERNNRLKKRQMMSIVYNGWQKMHQP